MHAVVNRELFSPPDTETLMSTTVQNARAERIAPQKDEGRIVPSVNYFTQNGMNGAYKRLGQLDKCFARPS
jgi:hypothetical protein